MRRQLAPIAYLFLLAGCWQGPPQGKDSPRQAQAAAKSAALLPRPSGPLLDEARVLNDGQAASIDAQLRYVFAATGHPIVVVTVSSLRGRSIEDYTLALFNRWEVGSREKPGVVFLVAPTEHRLRITTGRGLETKLPDAICAKIIRDDITPRFSAGDFAGGTSAGIDSLATKL